jgi:hypothetical protein
MTTDKDKQKKLLPLFILLSISLVAATTHAGESADSIVAGNFSQAQDLSRLPDGWQPLTFKNIVFHTTYRLVQDHDTTVIEAVSQASSSGLTRKLPINPLAYPVLSWKWKVANIYEKGDVTRKEGDDYPARIYITFAYDADKVGLWERVKFSTIKLFYGEYTPAGSR